MEPPYGPWQGTQCTATWVVQERGGAHALSPEIRTQPNVATKIEDCAVRKSDPAPSTSNDACHGWTSYNGLWRNPKVKGDLNKTGLYEKWAKQQKRRIAAPGELEKGNTFDPSLSNRCARVQRRS